MIVSVHLAEVGWLRAPRLLRRPDPAMVPGMSYAEPVLTFPLRAGRLFLLGPGGIGLIAVWEDDTALDRFLDSHPLAEHLACGWHVRLEPLRVIGSWQGMPDLAKRKRPIDDAEPVAALTLGRPRFSRLGLFMKVSGPAEHEALGNPDVLVSTLLGRPMHLISTFSLWRSAAAMREYAYRQDGPHRATIEADRARPFHYEAAFIRLRPYASQGSWHGQDPLAMA